MPSTQDTKIAAPNLRASPGPKNEPLQESHQRIHLHTSFTSLLHHSNSSTLSTANRIPSAAPNLHVFLALGNDVLENIRWFRRRRQGIGKVTKRET